MYRNINQYMSQIFFLHDVLEKLVSVYEIFMSPKAFDDFQFLLSFFVVVVHVMTSIFAYSLPFAFNFLKILTPHIIIIMKLSILDLHYVCRSHDPCIVIWLIFAKKKKSFTYFFFVFAYFFYFFHLFYFLLVYNFFYIVSSCQLAPANC